MDPRTREKIKVKARTTVRFKASPVLRATIGASRTCGVGRRAKASAGRQSSRESSPLGV
jgi:hypothetical protein